MTKEDMIKMVESRIKTEYDKYHNTPVDFVKCAAIKIVLTLEEDSKQVKNNIALDSVVGRSEQLVCDHSKHTFFRVLHKTRKCNGCGEIYEAN